jgi:hypothetical protein
MHRVADQLLGKLAGQIEFDAARRRVGAWQRDMKAARGRRDRPALHQQGGKNHHEPDIEIELRALQANHERYGGQKDADGAAQADP